jgi:hypothetical protein
MLANILNLVILVGLTSAALLICLAKWGVLAAWEVRRPSWLMKRCDFCLGYWVSVLLLAGYCYWYARFFGVSNWYVVAALPTALPAAAVCRAVAGTL